MRERDVDEPISHSRKLSEAMVEAKTLRDARTVSAGNRLKVVAVNLRGELAVHAYLERGTEICSGW